MKRISTPPIVQLVGEIDHPDFDEAIGLLRAQSRLATNGITVGKLFAVNPELIVVAQSRPGMIAARQMDALRRPAPLAGVVALLGSWCEGETRTGRPWPGVERLYWYEFPAWWRRQLALRAKGCCPEWSRPAGARFAQPNPDLTPDDFA